MAANKAIATVTPVRSAVKSLTLPAGTVDVLSWLAEKEAGEEEARDAGLQWLLATTHSAVVWGRKDGEPWRLSAGDTLPAASLLDLRAFGESAEVFVWRDESGLRARRREDGQGDELDTLEETQLLWGTEPDPERPPRDGFFPLRDGDQGLRHAPPLALDGSYFVSDTNDERYGHRPARLRLRHYVERDDGDKTAGREQGQEPDKDKGTGLARIVDSRLVELFSEPPKANKVEEVKKDVAKA